MIIYSVHWTEPGGSHVGVHTAEMKKKTLVRFLDPLQFLLYNCEFLKIGDLVFSYTDPYKDPYDIWGVYHWEHWLWYLVQKISCIYLKQVTGHYSLL